MATIEQVREENQRLQQQLQALGQQVAALQQNQQQQQQAQQQALLTPELVQRLAALPEHLTAAIAANRREGLVDIRGLGKPPALKDPPREGEFMVWCRKVETFAAAVYAEARTALPYVAESAAAVTAADIAVELPELNGDRLAELSSQLYTVLTSLTEGESFTLVTGSGPGDGFNAWRRLHKRWDPATAGRAGSLLREILAPTGGRAKIDDLQSAVETLEDKMRRYCNRKDQNGERHTLADDIRRAALESILPADLEKHIQMNLVRLATYDAMREEVMLYAEARGAVAGGRPKKERGPDDMDVGSFHKGKKGGKGKKGKGGKDGKGKGGGDKDKSGIVCWECGKKGHYGRDCWNKKKGGGGDGGGKGGKDKHGKGKGGKDTGALALEDKPPDAAELGTFDLSSLAAGASNSRNSRSSWVCVNVDSGAGATVWPSAAPYGTEHQASTSLTCRTATGELVTSERGLTVLGRDEYGRHVQISGHRAAVHKPLASAGEMTAKGHDILLTSEGGFVLRRSSPVLKEVRRAVERSAAKHDYVGMIPLVREKNIFNMYLETEVADGEEPFELAPLPAKGGPRRGPHP